MKLFELREYQAEFDKIKENFKPEYKTINSLRKRFTKDYPVNSILQLRKEQYVVGKGPLTFCSRIENELNAWGDIHGSPAIKFGLYYGRYGKDTERKYRIGRKLYGSDENIALKRILSAIVDILENKNNLEALTKNPISPMFKGKILSVYFPTEFLNIYSAKHLNYFINVFSLDNSASSELDKQALLLDFKNQDEVMIEWSIYEFSKFLYTSFGRPHTKKVDGNGSKELQDHILDDFPPIESVEIEYVNLDTASVPNSGQKGKQKRKKIDYEKRSKKLKRIGDRGEQIVFRAEKQYLIKHGMHALAAKVDHIAKRDDSVGYDIQSFNLDGTIRLIEVKATQQKVGKHDIFLTANELKTAEENANKDVPSYFFYIVYSVGEKKPKIWRLRASQLLVDDNIVRVPVLFRLSINVLV